MAFFGLFKSQEEKIRSEIRSGFKDCVKHAVNKDKRLTNSPFGGIIVQSAIVNFYTEMKNNSFLELLAAEHNLDYREILDQELNRALKKYLKYD